MRQDSAYYMLYAGLRPDAAWRLVAYPYYAKYTQPGDGTYFAHIDVNVSELIRTNRGGNVIQGTMSMYEEDDRNCTFLVPGMHKRVGE